MLQRMPGRYAEELRKITRRQGGPVDAGPTSEADGPASARRRYGPLIALAVVVVVAGLGWLLMRQMMADAKLQDCVASGRKNCAPIEPAPSAP